MNLNNYYKYLDTFEMELIREREYSLADVKLETSDGVTTNGTVAINEEVARVYTPRQESGIYEHAPDFRFQLPRETTVRGRERFLLEVCCGGNPKPTGAPVFLYC